MTILLLERVLYFLPAAFIYPLGYRCTLGVQGLVTGSYASPQGAKARPHQAQDHHALRVQGQLVSAKHEPQTRLVYCLVYVLGISVQALLRLLFSSALLLL